MNESLQTMVSAVASALEGNLHSFWLYGSVVLDDFRLGWSDIDFIALTSGPMTEGQAQRLLTLRQILSAAFPENPFYPCFEGIITPLIEEPEDSVQETVYWGTSGQRLVRRRPLDPFAEYQLSRFGRSLYGPSDRGLFRCPARDELAAAAERHYGAIRQHARQTNESLYSCGWLLDIARCVYTLRLGGVIGKTQAGEWALRERLFPE